MGLLDDVEGFLANRALDAIPGFRLADQVRQIVGQVTKVKSPSVNSKSTDKKPTSPTPDSSLANPSAPVTQNNLSQYDPLVNQVKFAQSIQPFVDSILQQAVGGIGKAAAGVNSAADQYQTGMQQVANNQDIPQQVRDILGNGADTANSARGVATGLAQSGQATGAYSLLMQAIQAMQAQEQANIQNEIELRKQIAVLQGGGSSTGSSDVLDALLSGQPVPKASKTTTP